MTTGDTLALKRKGVELLLRKRQRKRGKSGPFREDDRG
jgi:hypothetical protein